MRRALRNFLYTLMAIIVVFLLIVLGSPTTHGERRHISWWMWLLLPFALIAWALWWWLRGAQEEQSRHYEIPVPGPVEPSPSSSEERVAQLTTVEDGSPSAAETALTEPSKKEPDDLTVIEGIGPKIAKMLNDLGIYTYEDLANADPEVLRQTFRQARLYFVDPTTWPEQARLAAEGRWEELQALQDQLTAGRR